MAQRVMDCGDAGHILVSNAVAEVLSQLSTWSPFLRDLGEVEVKHGIRVHIHNLHTGEAGNPELPQKLRTIAAGPQQKAVPAPAAAIKPGQIEPGQTIGDYVALSQLGLGLTGEVYKVRHIISHRTEALKLLPPERTGGDQSDWFLREIRGLAGLLHPHIARFHTAFRADDRIAMVMEFIEGQDLQAKLRTHWPKRVAEGTEYILQVLSALEYAHARGVIHGDLKPSNIMITPQGQAKILDFGMPFEAADPGLSWPGTAVDSLYYKSPEQLSGERADNRSDLYSASVMLYEIVTGRRPFDGKTKHEIITGHLREQPKRPGDIDPAIPTVLSTILMKALAKQPAERFQTATDFLNALSRVSLDEANALQSLAIQPRARTSPSDAGRAPSNSPVGKPNSTTPPSGRSAPTPSRTTPESSRTTPESSRTTPKPSRSTLDPSVLDSVSNELAAFIGPIAKMVVRRAAERCSSMDDLYTAVAAEISSAQDRSSFLSHKKQRL